MPRGRTTIAGVDSRSIDGGPRGLRGPAVLLPVAAVLLGWALSGSSVGRALVRCLAALTALGGIVLAFAGRPATAAGTARTVAAPAATDDDGSAIEVVIPARDEAHVIGGLIGDLGRQVPRLGFRLVIVDDRSTDGTGAAATAAIELAGLTDRSRVLRRTAGPDGKAAALAFAADRSERRIGILVLDADARIDPAFLDSCRRAIREGSASATARRRVLGSPGVGRPGRWLVAAQAAEQAADHVVQCGRLALGGAGELRGNGMLLRGDLLADVGGWTGGALAEDLDLSTRVYLRTGRGAARPPGFEVWEQAAASPRAMLGQRLRWAEGSVRRDLAIVLPALADPVVPLRRRIDVATSAAQDLVPWLALGLVVRTARAGGTRTRRLRAARPAADLALGYAVAATAIALAADEPGLRATERVAAVLGLGASWAAILPIAWLRVARRPGRPAFRQTPHLPEAAVSPPPFASGEDGAGERPLDR
jgi:hypothetical protein